MEIKFYNKGEILEARIFIKDVEMEEANIIGFPEKMGLLEKLAKDAFGKADMNEVLFVTK